MALRDGVGGGEVESPLFAVDKAGGGDTTLDLIPAAPELLVEEATAAAADG